MAKRKEGHKVVFVEAPIELAERLKEVARLNHRSVNGEAVVAFERHVREEEAARSLDGGLSESPPAKSKGRGKKGNGK